ncbi:MAG: hypothetical protein WA840_10690, partial [Caulobacteraceae bacterium]
MASRAQWSYVGTMSQSGTANLPAPASPIPPAALAAIAPDWVDLQEQALLDHALELTASAGWGEALFARATRAAGMSTADAALLAPNGARDLAALLWRRHDQAAFATLAIYDLKRLKVRERIRLAVDVRIEAAMADETAVRAASLYLARPANAPTSLRLGWD